MQKKITKLICFIIVSVLTLSLFNFSCFAEALTPTPTPKPTPTPTPSPTPTPMPSQTSTSTINQGLLAYYNFDDTAVNIFGVNNGKIKGNVKYTEGVFGKAVQLDGTSYISFGDMQFNPTGRTISLWVKELEGNNGKEILSKHSGFSDVETLIRKFGGNYWFEITIDGNFYTNSNNYTFANNGFDLVTETYDGNELKLYINGSQIYSRKVSGLINNNNFGLTLGAYASSPDGVSKFKGCFDDLRIYNRALSTSEINELYRSEVTVSNSFTPDQGLLAYYNFDDTTNNSLGANNGIIKGNVKYTDGVIGKAVELDGNSYVSFGDVKTNPEFRTISLWVKELEGNNSMEILSKHSGYSDVETLLRKSRGKYWSEITINGNFYTNSSDSYIFENEGFDLLTETYDGKELKLYANGSLIYSRKVSGSICDNSWDLMLGAYAASPDGVNKFKGCFDDLRIYNRVLSQTQINELYHQVVGFTYTKEDFLGRELVYHYDAKPKSPRYVLNALL